MKKSLIKKFLSSHQQAQSTIEFSILVIIIIAALLLIQVYFKRGIQGRWKTAVDELSEELYDPYLANSEVTYRVATNAVVDISTREDGQGIWTMRTDQTNSLDTRSGKTFIGGI